jgi:hypothetical protein
MDAGFSPTPVLPGNVPNKFASAEKSPFTIKLPALAGPAHETLATAKKTAMESDKDRKVPAAAFMGQANGYTYMCFLPAQHFPDNIGKRARLPMHKFVSIGEFTARPASIAVGCARAPRQHRTRGIVLEK